MSDIKPFSGVDDRVCLADVIPLSTPFTLNVFPSNICNFRCSYCAQSLGTDYLSQNYQLKRELMSFDVLEKIVNQSKSFDRPYKLVSFMGHGEPLCNRELPRMIRLIKQAEIAERVDVITNASLLTHSYSEALIASGLDVLRVSLQGISSDSYLQTCGVKLSFEDLLSELDFFYQIRGACKLYVKTMDVTLPKGESEQFFQLFSERSDRMYIDKVKPVYAGVSYSKEAQDLSTDRYGLPHIKRMVCPQPFYMLSVWPNGDATPCDALYQGCPLGNIKHTTLKEMWDSKRLREFQRAQLEHKRNRLDKCSLCCAPDDVSQPEDILDGQEEKLLNWLREKVL